MRRQAFVEAYRWLISDCDGRWVMDNASELGSSAENRAAAEGIRRVVEGIRKRESCFWLLARVLHYPERHAPFEMGLPNALRALAVVADDLAAVEEAVQLRALALEAESGVVDGTGRAADTADGEEPASIDSAVEELRLDYSRMLYAQRCVRAYGASCGFAACDELDQVMRAYRRAGLAVRDDCSERPDHIALEFDFLFYLASMELQAANDRDLQSAYEWRRVAVDFWEKHLSGLVVAFARDLESCTACSFYELLSRILLRLNRRALFGD